MYRCRIYRFISPEMSTISLHFLNGPTPYMFSAATLNSANPKISNMVLLMGVSHLNICFRKVIICVLSGRLVLFHASVLRMDVYSCNDNIFDIPLTS